MSQETLTWLNNNVLVGFTDKRGNAWHHRASDQGIEPNHYAGAIPVDDVLRRLFAWHAIERELFVSVPCEADNLFGASGIDSSGRPFQSRPVPGRKAIVADDTYEVLGVFSDGYRPHQYDEWLLSNVANLLDADLGIASAGLLRNRAVAWVQVEVPESITTPEGVEFRPNLTAATSLDGSLSTTYARQVTNVVCDNTLHAGLSETGQRIKIKHSSRSLGRLGDAREALAIVYSAADDFAAEVTRLCNWEVSPAEWSRLLDLNAEVPTTPGRGQTLATAKRDSLESLWARDARVSPWAGTAFGVLQAFNTYDSHVKPVRGNGRAERASLNALTGRQAAADNGVLLDLSKITGRQLVSA